MTRKPQIPENNPVQPFADTLAEIAASAEAPVSKVPLTQLPQAQAEELIMNTYDVEIVKGNARGSGGWLHSPALLEMFSVAYKRLVKVAEQRSKESRDAEEEDAVGDVTHVRAARPKGKKLIYIYPTSEKDPEAIPVNRAGSAATINLITLLGPSRLTIETGYKVRYALEFAGPKSPVGAALVLDQNRPLERRLTTKKGKKATAGSPAPANPNEDQTPEH